MATSVNWDDIRAWWYRKTDRHPDGSKHDWSPSEPAGPHPCVWDYCRCSKHTCSICQVTQLISSGLDDYD